MSSLYPFQKQALDELCATNNKHIAIMGTGCLAKGTPVRLANGKIKLVEKLKSGDELLSFDETTGRIFPNTIDKIVRSYTQPKPMIELSYDGERITTTYDHYFYAENGYAPLYQLVWGALETSQRVQLQLLCKQYGQNCDDNLFWRKRSWNNEPRQERQVGTSKNHDGREECISPQSYCGNLVEKPLEFAIREPYQFRPNRQQSRKSRVLFKKIQCVSWLSQREYQKTDFTKQQQSFNQRRAKRNKRLLSKIYAKYHKQPRKSETLQKIIQKISHSRSSTNTEVCNWSVKIKVPAPYYTISMRQAPYTYCIGRKHNYLTHNCGKGAIGVLWAKEACKQSGLRDVMIVSTASKANMSPTDFHLDADKWCGEGWRKSLSSFSVISWHKLARWQKEHATELDKYVYVFDELAKAKSGITSARGGAFLRITAKTKWWTGYTATPGDDWISLYPYLQATGLVKHKTEFKRLYCNIQTYKGFPEIVSYLHEDKLKAMWASITTAPDTSQMDRELPPETHKVITFKKPKGYDKVAKTHTTLDGEFLETSGAYCAELRRMCFDKHRQQWVKDFVEGLGTRAVMFYNFISTGDKLADIIQKALPKGAKVWRVDGSHHEIPTAETIGKYDIVLCQWQSGSEGLNLQMINHFVSVEPHYSYSTSIQARGRVRRIGQARPQFYRYLRSTGTIEDAIYDALKNKSVFSEENWLAAQKGE